MSTAFDGARHRGRKEQIPLTDFPDWAIEVMRGLYGPVTIDAAIAGRRRSETLPRANGGDGADRRQAADDLAGPGQVQPLSPLQAELEALELVADLFLRVIRRRR